MKDVLTSSYNSGSPPLPAHGTHGLLLAQSHYFTWTENDNMWYSLLDLKIPVPREVRAHVTVTDDSPWFSGHFPEDPILPGIAQLKMVADIIGQAREERLSIKRLNRIKFKKIVRPGEQLEIHATATSTFGLYSFRITHDAQDVCSGTMFLDDKQH